MELNSPDGKIFSTNVIAITTLLVIFACVCYNALFKRTSLDPKAPGLISANYPILGAIEFFTKRGELFHREGAKSQSGNFSFYVGYSPVVGVTGHAGRSPFFESPQLSLGEGQSFLFGASPSFKADRTEDTPGTEAFTAWFSKRLLTLLTRKRLNTGLPTLVSDVKARLKAIATEPWGGVTDPFDSVFKIVFQLTMRTVGCEDIASDDIWCDKLLRKFEVVEKSFGASDVILPWLPTFSKLRRTISGAGLYMDFKKIVDERKKQGKWVDDPLQHLIDSGDSMQKIIGFEMGALFAGQLNTGHNAAFSAYYFARYPEWQKKAREELERVAREHSTDPSVSLEEQLSSLPIETWENEFKILDKCLRECIRLQLTGSSIRKNISEKPVYIGKEVIQPGGFAAYQFAEPHMDPSLYPEPQLFDPSRYDPDRAEDKKQPHAYVGWGSGRHPCLGMRFAKLEYFIIMAFMLAYYDLSACDKQGNPIAADAPFPKTELNAFSSKQPERPIYVKCTSR